MDALIVVVQKKDGIIRLYNSYTSSPGIYGIYKPEGPEL